jgi:hypothetical protein
MLVCAFAGYDRVMAAYRHAVAAGYRFFSYGDAMLLTRARLHPRDRARARPRPGRLAAHPARLDPAAGVHAGRHPGHGQGHDPRRARGAAPRRPDHPRQHLPPVPAPGPRGHRRRRRPAPLRRLGAADPHRLGRLPGVLAREGGHRRRRHLPLRSRRQTDLPLARTLDGHPAGARVRHRDGVRRVPRLRHRCVLRARQRRSHHPLGTTQQGRAHPARPVVVRHRPGRHRRRPPPPPAQRRSHRERSASTATPSAACRSASRSPRCTGCSTSSPTSCPPIARAT